MTFLSILIALLLERITPQLMEFRRFNWMRDYSQWLIDVLRIEKLNHWMGLSVLLIPIVVLIWMLNSMFDNALFGLFELAFNVAVIFLCIGPRDLNKQIEAYLDAIEVGDSQQRFDRAQSITPSKPAMELPVQVVQVCKSLFVAANTRIYSILFWFVLLGPVGAVLYRIIHQIFQLNLLEQSLDPLKQNCRFILGWMDWIPVHISLFSYMVSGRFEEGLQVFRQGSLGAVDVYEQNVEMLQSVGFQSVTTDGEVTSDNEAMDLVRKSRGIILRSLVVWLLVVLLLSAIS